MKKNTGYKEMLRDRCPKVVSFALKWCKAKEKWLDYVYKEQIWILSSKKERLDQTKAILGITGKYHNFCFDDTIVWEALSKEENEYWKQISNWVSFFVTKYAYIENTYINSKTTKSIEELKLQMINSYLMQFCPSEEDDEITIQSKSDFVNSLADYLIDCIEGNIQ